MIVQGMHRPAAVMARLNRTEDPCIALAGRGGEVNVRGRPASEDEVGGASSAGLSANIEAGPPPPYQFQLAQRGGKLVRGNLPNQPLRVGDDPPCLLGGGTGKIARQTLT